MYYPKYFSIRELVPEPVLVEFGEARCWRLLDDRILRLADLVRETYGPMVCNNWATGGDRTQSGLRVPGQQFYRATSQHAYGRALDLIPRTTDITLVRQGIVNERQKFHLCRGLERDVSWLHIDVRNSDKLEIF